MRDLVLHFDFGYSYEFDAPVRELIFDRLPATIFARRRRDDPVAR